MLSTVLPILAIAAATARAQQINSTTSLSGSYVPTYIECPSGQTFVRPASSGLSSREETWLKTRKTVVTDALQTYLTNANISGFDVQGYISTLKGDASLVPTVAMTLSGGGQRAEFCGLALVQALDARYPSALEAKTGGLLQAISYQSGRE
jgi:lysophospholipase